MKAFASIGCGLQRLRIWGCDSKGWFLWDRENRQPSGSHVRLKQKKKKGNLKFKEPQHLSSFPLRDTMDTLTAFPSVSGGSDNPLRREGKFLQSQGA